MAQQLPAVGVCSPSLAPRPSLAGLLLPGAGTGPQGTPHSSEMFKWEAGSPGQQLFPTWDP